VWWCFCLLLDGFLQKSRGVIREFGIQSMKKHITYLFCKKMLVRGENLGLQKIMEARVHKTRKHYDSDES
jgi:hypothetical protein